MSTDLAIPPKAVQLLGQMSATADHLATIVEVLPLETPEDETLAANMVRAIETMIRESEAVRKEIVKPIKAQASEVDKAFRAPRTSLAALGDKIRARLQEAAEKRERERLAAIALVAQADTSLQEANEALAVVQAPAPETPGVSMRWRWGIESLDPSKVPEEYKTVNMPALKALCKSADAGGPEPSVTGVTFVKRAFSTVRSL